jgi:DNA mismatch endonuclease, patch repair protein
VLRAVTKFGGLALDIYSPAQRSAIMSRIRSADTKPEVRLRKALFARGFRYRKNVRGLAGTPDIVLRKHKYIVQVRGCFWHVHQHCRRSHVPASNCNYWLPKLDRNVTRDRKADRELRAAGWRVRVVWECALSSKDRVENIANRISADINQRPSKSGRYARRRPIMRARPLLVRAVSRRPFRRPK